MLLLLAGGSPAAPYQVFHERFPFELVRMTVDERTLRREIGVAIKNINGIRVGMFTPDMAFEAVAKRLIEKLLGPCLKCVEMTVLELNEVVQDIGDTMAEYATGKEPADPVVVAAGRLSAY